VRRMAALVAATGLLPWAFGCDSRDQQPRPVANPSASSLPRAAAAHGTASARTLIPSAAPPSNPVADGDSCRLTTAPDLCLSPARCVARTSGSAEEGVCAVSASFEQIHANPTSFAGTTLLITDVRAVPQGWVCSAGVDTDCDGKLVVSDIAGNREPARFLRLFNDKGVELSCRMKGDPASTRCTFPPYQSYRVLGRLRDRPARALTVEAMIPETKPAP